MSAPTPKGPFHIGKIGEVDRILDKKGRDVMMIEGGPDRLIECANAFGEIWFPETHIKESELYSQRLEQLRKDAWARVQELEALIATDGQIELDGGAIAAVKGQSRLANVNDVEPLPSNQIVIWNFDMSAAPHDAKIIALGSASTVTLSRWMSKREAWDMYTKDVPPIAWQPWPSPAVPA